MRDNFVGFAPSMRDFQSLSLNRHPFLHHNGLTKHIVDGLMAVAGGEETADEDYKAEQAAGGVEQRGKADERHNGANFTDVLEQITAEKNTCGSVGAIDTDDFQAEQHLAHRCAKENLCREVNQTCQVDKQGYTYNGYQHF